MSKLNEWCAVWYWRPAYWMISYMLNNPLFLTRETKEEYYRFSHQWEQYLASGDAKLRPRCPWEKSA